MLTVLGVSKDVYIDPKRGSKYKKWDCLCDCGKIVSVRTDELKRGRTRSCGCLQRKITIERNYVHGKSNTRLYYVWQKIKKRCYNPNDKAYKDYGGRGITVCDEWCESFSAFEDWALNNGYDPALSGTQCSIDRINNNEGYTPENCRWVDYSEQSKNRRFCHYISFNGETHTLTDWAKIIGISRSALNNRILYSNMTLEEALTIPLGKYKGFQRRIEKEKENNGIHEKRLEGSEQD